MAGLCAFSLPCTQPAFWFRDASQCFLCGDRPDACRNAHSHCAQGAKAETKTSGGVLLSNDAVEKPTFGTVSKTEDFFLYVFAKEYGDTSAGS